MAGYTDLSAACFSRGPPTKNGFTVPRLLGGGGGEQAGEVVSNAAVDPYVAAGAYYDKDVRTPASAAGQDMELQAALWAVTMNILVSGGDLQRAVDLG